MGVSKYQLYQGIFMKLFAQKQDVLSLELDKFLSHVVRSEKKEIQGMLEKDINLLLRTSEITDCSDRVFSDCTGYQYALWAMDKPAWDAMLQCIPQGEQGTRVATQLLQQLEHLKAPGLKYTIQDKAITEQHYDFALIQALEHHENYFSTPIKHISNWDEMNQHWRIEVGDAQRKAPMWIVHEFCGGDPFVQNEFDTPPAEIQTCYNENGQKITWFGESNQKRLGRDFAFRKRIECTPYSGPTAEDWYLPNLELEAMETLSTLRTEQFNNHEQELRDLVQKLNTEYPSMGF